MDTIRLAVSRAGGVTLDRELGDHDTELAPAGSQSLRGRDGDGWGTAGSGGGWTQNNTL